MQIFKREIFLKKGTTIKKTPIFLGLVIITTLMPPVALADILTLKDGTVLDGAIAAENADGTEIYFAAKENPSEPRWISVSDIQSIRFNSVPVKSKADSLH